MRYFNVAGPCIKAKHYMIDAASRLQGIEQLIDMEQENLSEKRTD